MPRPHAVIIAGPNGAGKTTLAPRLLAGELGVRTFVNVDILAQGLAGFDPASAAVQAWRIMHRWLDELRRARVDFAFETTLSGLSLRRTIVDLHASGYETLLVYLWIPSADLAVDRVQTRVRMGGHAVPEQDVRRRFLRSVRNFEQVYRRVASRWWVYDAVQSLAKRDLDLIARGSADTVSVENASAWAEIQSQAASPGETR